MHDHVGGTLQGWLETAINPKRGIWERKQLGAWKSTSFQRKHYHGRLGSQREKTVYKEAERPSRITRKTQVMSPGKARHKLEPDSLLHFPLGGVETQAKANQNRTWVYIAVNKILFHPSWRINTIPLKAFSPPFRFALLGLVKQHLQPFTHKQQCSIKTSPKIKIPSSKSPRHIICISKKSPLLQNLHIVKVHVTAPGKVRLFLCFRTHQAPFLSPLPKVKHQHPSFVIILTPNKCLFLLMGKK